MFTFALFPIKIIMLLVENQLQLYLSWFTLLLLLLLSQRLVINLQADGFPFFGGQHLAELGDLGVEHLLHARLAESKVSEISQNETSNFLPRRPACANDAWNEETIL